MNENKTASDLVSSLPVFCFSLLVIYLIQHCWKRRRFYYYGWKIPGKSGLPFLGSTELFIHGRDVYADKLLEFAKNCKRIAKFWIGSDLAIFVTEPEIFEFLARKCLAKSSRYDCLKPGFREGLLTAPLEKWKRHRPIVNKTFKYNILCSYMPIFVKHTNKLLEELKKIENTKVDIFEKYCKCAFSIVHESCMGVDWSDKQEHVDYMRALIRGGQIVCEHMVNPFLQVDLIWKLSPLSREVERQGQVLWEHAAKVLKFKKSEFEKNRNDILSQQCFLNNLLKITYEDGAWTDEELMEETQNMIAAGSDTTAITLSFLSLMLAIHPEIQDKVYKELASIFEDGHVDVTLDDLNEMEYLDRALKETMRLFPAAPFLMRQLGEDIKIDEYLIPKDTTLFFPILCIHRDPVLWPDPLKFDPDRFLPEAVEKRPRYAYVPFSVGPRNCVGFKFAEMSMKVMFANVLRKYKITSNQYKSVDEIKLQVNVLAASLYGYQVTLVPRYIS